MIDLKALFIKTSHPSVCRKEPDSKREKNSKAKSFPKLPFFLCMPATLSGIERGQLIIQTIKSWYKRKQIKVHTKEKLPNYKFEEGKP